MGYLTLDDLQPNKTYHIKNNWAETLDDLWWNDCLLVEIDEEWGEPTMLTFKNAEGKEITIDGEFVAKTSGPLKSDRSYQILEKKS